MSARIDEHLARLKARGWDFGVPWAAVELIGRSEDCRLVAYQCIAGVWTNGWGETAGVTADMRWTEDQADARYAQQLRKYATRVEALCAVTPTPNQLGAMVSLAYNIGLEAFARSTVLRQHNTGNAVAAARAFALWNKARVAGVLQEVRGLTLRRGREAALYLTPEEGAPGERMPQAVEAESSLGKSPMVRDGAVATVGGAALAVAPLADQLGQASGLVATIKGFAQQVADFIGVPPLLIVAGVLVYVGVNVIRWRKRQRSEGWA